MSDEAKIRPYKTPRLNPRDPLGPEHRDADTSSAPARASSSAVPATPPSSKKSNAEPTVRVIREEGLVRSIEVDCSCGKAIRLDCVYEEGSNAPRAVPAKARKKPAAPAKAAEDNRGSRPQQARQAQPAQAPKAPAGESPPRPQSTDEPGQAPGQETS